MFVTDPNLAARANARLGAVLRGKYRLDHVLGIGGMATVYRATHRNGNEFAVKLLHAELSMRPDVRTRFLREGHAASTVKHPGAVQVLDDDVAEDGSAFLVMELLRGESVESFWEHKGHRLPEKLVAGIGLQLLDVISAAHGRGVIHRDIKPANLFLTEHGHIKVLDFGIARLRDMASGEATQAGTMMGTPAFMAPEQAMGKTSEVDAQTDVWAVGATLFTLISGRLVHEGESVQEIMVRAATMRASPVSSLYADVSPPVAEVLDRALSFDKAQRWPTAAGMRDALQQAAKAAYGTVPTAQVVSDLVEDMRERTIVDAFQPPASSREGLRMQAVKAASSSVTAVVASEVVFPSQMGPPPAQRPLVQQPSWNTGPARPQPPPVVSSLATARTVAAPVPEKQSAGASLFIAFAVSFLAVALGGAIALFLLRDRLAGLGVAPATSAPPAASSAPPARTGR